MMPDNRRNSSCPREDDILLYLYREMSPAETDRFESHLAVCGSCVDELAAVSLPHLEVYEWRTNVFDKIPAPSIELPLFEEQRPHAESLLGRLSALLSGWPAGLRVGVGFAALLIIGFSVFLLSRTTASPDVARSIEGPQQPQFHEPAVESEPPTVADVPDERSESDAPGIAVGSIAPDRKTVRANEHPKMTAKPTAVRARKGEYAVNRKEKPPEQRSLRLNNFDEDEDTTLRLADLFDEVGSL